MFSKTGIAFAVASLAATCGVGWLIFQDSPSFERSLVPLEQVGRSADQVDVVIPFVARPERQVELGSFRISERDGLYSLTANEAFRSELLAALAVEGDFAILDHVRRHPSISLDIRDESLEVVFAHLLRDEPYSVRYAFADTSDALSIDLVEVGAPQDVVEFREGELDRSEVDSEESGVREAKLEDLAKRTDQRSRPAPPPRSETERRGAMERRAQREAERYAESLQELDDADPEIRAWAASDLDVNEPRDLAPLTRLLGNDPDPLVRAEIAYGLGFGEPSTALPLLISALQDPSPEVVVMAAESLGYLDDASAVAHLEELEIGQPQNVRDAAIEALSMLEGAD